MLYFIYDTEQEIKDIDSVICKKEGIGQNADDVTKNYAQAMLLENGTFAYLCDEITSKYIIDKEPIEIEG
jgi:hypothetical protein